MKKIQMTKYISILSVALAFIAKAESSNHEANVKFKVTVSNVTAANGLSPFLAVISKKGASLFSVGKEAGPGIAAIAETGNTALLESELANNVNTITVAKAQGGPIPAGESRSVEFELSSQNIRQGATLRLVAMIGKSNDSFVSLPATLLLSVYKQGSVYLNAVNYDAGSEENTGNVSDFGPGGHPVDGAEGKISIDRGLNLRGDAPEVIGWGSVAARVFIERIH